MRLGVFVLAPRFPGQTDHAALDRALGVVVAADRAGLADAWVAEHHFMPYGVCPDALTFAAHALGRTGRIALGTAVSVLSTTHPVALAERTLLLDALTGGRFRLGVGRGGPWVDLEVFGSSLDRLEHAFPDTLDLLLRALTGPTVSGDRWFPFREVPVVPAPRTRPPVLVACTSDRGVEAAAERGLPMLLGMHIGDDDKRALVERYRRAGGPVDAEHVSTVVVHIARSREEAVREVMATAPGWLRAGLAAHIPVDDRPGPTRDPVAYARLLCDLHPVGDPDYCARRLRESAERSGIAHLIAMVEATGSAEAAVRAVEWLGGQVVPTLSTPLGPEHGSLA
ncbi:LLM class flavin-dependent oxidoreductase [Actinokineospora iranica]|uniref:Flavin-dependent oxidoreductase, luciferase family (Includes alkanesulfonate monooxygenase SsuD and methylene tetrahydromethanopterin reductase) n=1 Tax=Actinokineospora iranica TaxID=1271860 RepID=A0A1G6VFS3_9PSEU|nr:LLM class flavin-dependent oxidoreductase [Actinokineospora iranica]SDD52193.1 Flavin-dependent oxidoreductase, luciferase family (includes alkanesulfonate monooxygenase SsuD and methylene tetrahydromethanopterin reductase) [Actinokineospora iranica]